jgi:serine protease AprX
MSADAPGGRGGPTQHRVQASVILRASSGKSAREPDAPITPQNVASYMPAEDAPREAADALQRLGFDVDHVGLTHVTISGDKALFERVFGARLAAKSHPVFGGQRAAAHHVHFASDRPLSVPESLSRLVDAVELAKPAAFFADPTPPNVPYPHIGVPDDVARGMDAAAAHEMGVTGRGVTLAMVDSGFMTPFHPYYEGRGYDIKPVVPDPSDPSPGDDSGGHGTGVAACALAVAPGVSLTIYKANPASVNSVSLTDAFSRAVAAAPDIISCSWGTQDHFENPLLWPDLRVLVNHAVAAGIVVLFATGNAEGPVSWPASEPAVISVGGAFWTGDGRVTASSFCRSGTNYINKSRECPDVCGLSGMAPRGVYVAVPTQPESAIDRLYAGGIFPGGDETLTNDGWVVASGTSVATPMVAGVCALMLQHDPALRRKPARVRDALERSCLDVVCGSSASGLPAGLGRDNATGFGLAQAHKAIRALDARNSESAEVARPERRKEARRRSRASQRRLSPA